MENSIFPGGCNLKQAGNIFIWVMKIPMKLLGHWFWMSPADICPAIQVRRRNLWHIFTMRMSTA